MSIVLFEGMDGTGKSTLVRSVATALDAKGKTVRIQAFPSKDSPIGQFIREAIFSGEVQVDERAMLPLMVADAFDCDARLTKWNKEFDFVLLDRHSIISAWAYQIGPHMPAEVAAFSRPELFDSLPSAIFLLDAPAEVVIERQEKRGGASNPLYEKGLEYAKTLRNRYLAISTIFEGNAPIVLIDATQTPATLTERVVGILLKIPV